MTTEITTETRSAIETVNALLKEGRLALLGAGAYVSPLSPEFKLGVLARGVWRGAGLLIRPDPLVLPEELGNLVIHWAGKKEEFSPAPEGKMPVHLL